MVAFQNLKGCGHVDFHALTQKITVASPNTRTLPHHIASTFVLIPTKASSIHGNPPHGINNHKDTSAYRHSNACILFVPVDTLVELLLFLPCWRWFTVERKTHFNLGAWVPGLAVAQQSFNSSANAKKWKEVHFDRIWCRWMCRTLRHSNQNFRMLAPYVEGGDCFWTLTFDLVHIAKGWPKSPSWIYPQLTLSSKECHVKCGQLWVQKHDGLCCRAKPWRLF